MFHKKEMEEYGIRYPGELRFLCKALNTGLLVLFKSICGQAAANLLDHTMYQLHIQSYYFWILFF